MPRSSNDPKEETLKLRLNEQMRKHIEKKSHEKNCSMSEYIRKLITKDIQSI